MRYLLRRGPGALRRIAHLCGHDPLTGQPMMQPFCATPGPYDLNSNVPWGRPTCKACTRIVARLERAA